MLKLDELHRLSDPGLSLKIGGRVGLPLGVQRQNNFLRTDIELCIIQPNQQLIVYYL